MTIVDDVKRICLEEAKSLPGVEVIAPLAVWDNGTGSMGVQIKAPQNRAGQPCEVMANFVLSPDELRKPDKIRMKAKLAVDAVKADIQVQIRPWRPLKDVDADKAQQEAAWAVYQSGKGAPDAD